MTDKCNRWELKYADVAKAHQAHFPGQQTIQYKYIRLRYEIHQSWYPPVILKVTKSGRDYDDGCQIWVNAESIGGLSENQAATAIFEPVSAIAFYRFWFWHGWKQQIKLAGFIFGVTGLALELWLSFGNNPTTPEAIDLALKLKILSFALKVVGLILVFAQDSIVRINSG